MSQRLPDHAAREAAASVFDRNLVVVAGAGTGKTSLLVERALNLLLTGTAALESLVAITFTEKAAAEMKERLSRGLGAVLDATDPGHPVAPAPHSEAERSLHRLRDLEIGDPELHQRARRLLERVDGAAVSTIHSFCSEILRRHPVEAGVPPDYSPDEGIQQQLLFTEAWPSFLARELGDTGPDPEGWERVLAEFPIEELTTLARELIRSPAALDHLVARGYQAGGPEALITEAGTLRPRLAAALGEASQEKFLRNGHAALRHLDALLEAGLAGLLAHDDPEVPLETLRGEKSSAPWRGKAGPDKDRVEQTLADALALLKQLDGLESRDLPGVMAILRRFAVEFREASLRAGTLAFDDLLVLARNLVRDHPGVRRAEAARARTILLDEFQDTDPLQYELMFLLAAKPFEEPIEDAYSLELEAGRLFIVGDPKQSIYRFRGADMSAYDRAVRHVVAGGGARYTLTTNFRSVPGVLDPVNRLFEEWMGPEDPEDESIEPRYDPIDAHRAPTSGAPATELWSVEARDGAGAVERRTAEGVEIARALTRVFREGLDGEPVAPGDVVLLFRSLHDLPLYARALHRAGIDYVVDGGKAFVERPEVVEATGLLRALADPGDPAATLAALRSSLGGVPDPELGAFARAGGQFSWRRGANPADLEAAHPSVTRVFAWLRDLHDAGRDHPLDRHLREILTEGAWAAVQAAYYDGPQRTANLRKLADFAGELIRERGLTLHETVLALETEFQGDRLAGESPLADEQGEAVRMMSIHKAKGLEFPVVILPDLARGQRNLPPDPYVKLHPAADGPRLAVRTRHGLDGAAQRYERENAEHEKAEAKRILYVAMTRAENRLILVNSGRERDLGPWVKALRESWGYAIDRGHPEGSFPNETVLPLAPVTHRSLRLGEPAEGEIAVAPLDVAACVRAFDAAVADPRLGPVRRSRSPSGDHRARLLDLPADDEAEAAITPPPEVARLTGLTLHAVMEQWDFADADAARALMRAILPRYEAEAPDPEALRHEAETVLESLLASDLPTELATLPVLGREVPILYRDAAGLTVHGFADLVHARDGRLTVADYKTDVVRGDPRQAAERYISQLHDYAEAVRQAFGLAEPVPREVIFLRTGSVVALPVPEE